MLKLDLVTIIGTVVNLLILYFLMKKFLFGRVDKILEQRQKAVDEQFKKASDAAAAAAAQQEKLTQLEAQARQKQADILKETAQKADAEYKSIVDAAGEKAKAMQSAAEDEIQKKHDDMMKRAEKEVAQMAVEAADRITAKQTGPDVDSRLYDEFIRETGEKD
ncbi:MAG: ATP synthase F0 subunit B [Lachnospiraceae bacterium]|nr:ATP synthase F0 subunit B [Lachnospiraceae bacterium]